MSTEYRPLLISRSLTLSKDDHECTEPRQRNPEDSIVIGSKCARILCTRRYGSTTAITETAISTAVFLSPTSFKYHRTPQRAAQNTKVPAESQIERFPSGENAGYRFPGSVARRFITAYIPVVIGLSRVTRQPSPRPLRTSFASSSSYASGDACASKPAACMSSSASPERLRVRYVGSPIASVRVPLSTS